MRIDKLASLIAFALLLSACGGGKGSAIKTRSFPNVQIPAVYSTEEDIITYLQNHYWDKFLSTDTIWPSDSLTVNGVSEEALEEAFSSFVALTESLDIQAGRKAMAAFFTALENYQEADTSSTAFRKLSGLVTKYYYDPNSPYRNEDLYLPFVSRLAESRFTEESQRSALRFDAKQCALNPIGLPAADFRFVDIKGRFHHLYDIRGEYTLLFFSNPGCEACKEIIDILNGAEDVQELIATGKLAVANIYIDENRDEWKSYQDHYPDSWYNGYDPDYIIRGSLLYSVRAIPSLYLLDRDKRVIFKDAPQESIFAFLKEL